ncbi:MAG: DoxX family protein [Paracoccus sp. (in: a-proteobacteria)]|nr:DoxX family protein [Paracoccus sp. (in: a-proteobacteria)]
MNTMISSLGLGGPHAADRAALILRVSLGALFVAHAGLKIFVFTPAGTVDYFASLGLPAVVAYLTIAAELLGGLALIAGFQTSLVALALIPVLLGAAVLGHGSNGFWFSNAGGGWEYPAFWTVALVVQAMLGGGAFALSRN